MKPELYLSDALGATGKPMFRVHTAVRSAAHGHRRGPPRRDRPVTGGSSRWPYQKQSEGNAQFALGSGRGFSIGAGGAFAPLHAQLHVPHWARPPRSSHGGGEGPQERAEEPLRAT